MGGRRLRPAAERDVAVAIGHDERAELDADLVAHGDVVAFRHADRFAFAHADPFAFSQCSRDAATRDEVTDSHRGARPVLRGRRRAHAGARLRAS